MAFLIQQARVDMGNLRGKRVGTGRCSSRGEIYSCTWAFPGDGFGYADEESKRLETCVAAFPSARKLPGKTGAAQFAVEPDVLVTIPAPEIDGDGHWAVGFKIRQSEGQ